MADITVTPERIYAEYRDKVIRYVESKVSRKHDSEDVVSDIFERIVRNLPGYEGRSSLSTWVYSIAKRAVMDHYRQMYARSEPIDTARTLPDPEEEYIRKETLLALGDALDELGERERDIVVLHYFDEMPLTEIAVTKGMSYSNTKVVHKAALAKLRKILSDRNGNCRVAPIK